MKMRTLILILLITTFNYSVSYACICIEENKELINQYKKDSDIIFIGKPISNYHYDEEMRFLLNERNSGTDVLIKVDSVIKGDINIGDTLFIYQFGGSCDQNFEFDKSYFVFAESIKEVRYDNPYKDKNSLPPPPPTLDSGQLTLTHDDDKFIQFLKRELTIRRIITTSMCQTYNLKSRSFKELGKNY